VEEVVAATPATKTTTDADAADTDDLKKIEGVGPKIEQLLHEGGLKTYSQVSEASADAIREILAAAGNRYKMHDPTTWPDQAKMAAEGEWDKLKEWQDNLQGGK
jgi:predicted flap endonuclease-1-like 5' DNA nuclease